MHGVDNDHLTDIEVRQPVELGEASRMLFHERVSRRLGGTFEIFFL
jgi:hypothetical protein